MKSGKASLKNVRLPMQKKLLRLANSKNTTFLLPSDVIVGDIQGRKTQDKLLSQIHYQDTIYDIGPQTQAIYGQAISTAKTLIWNGPVGLFEKDAYRRGTDFIYYAIAHNSHAISIVGGGETIAALSHNEHLERITHISTGGGAMLEYIENGTLPGIDALEK